MGTRPTKAMSNVFCSARLEASKYNDKLRSRDGAAEMLGYASSSTIADWELGVSIPTPEAVLKMADLYKAPELMNHYCTQLCPLGKNMPKVEALDLDRITVRALATFNRVSRTKELLLDITEDGVITEAERGDLKAIMTNLEELEKVAQNLKCWVKKNLD